MYCAEFAVPVHKVCKRCKDEYLAGLHRDHNGKVEATFELVLRRHPVTKEERELAAQVGGRPAALETT